MDVKKFTDFIKESVKINEKIELYRLVSVGNDEDLVIDVYNPGKYYFKDEGDIKPEVLKKQSGNYHIIKVTTDESNIDEELSKIESDKHNCDCVVLKDDSKAEYEGSEPFK